MKIHDQSLIAAPQIPSEMNSVQTRIKLAIQKWGVGAAMTFFSVLWLTLVAATWSSN